MPELFRYDSRLPKFWGTSFSVPTVFNKPDWIQVIVGQEETPIYSISQDLPIDKHKGMKHITVNICTEKDSVKFDDIKDMTPFEVFVMTYNVKEDAQENFKVLNCTPVLLETDMYSSLIRCVGHVFIPWTLRKGEPGCTDSLSQ